MKKSFIIASLFAVFAGQANAAPAVYQDDVLTISEAVVIRDNGSRYFKNVRFTPNANGTWSFVSGSERPLAAIEEITVVTEATNPPVVEVTVEGYKSVPCVELEPLGMSRSGDTFYVVIAETVQDPEESCIAMIDPFTLTFELDTFGLEAGAYKLNVNGNETEFDLLVP
ncbi:MAG: hypothetical protein ACO1PZ_04080 [Gammaproteobacteria bacterium]